MAATLILASTSRYRAQLLSSLALPFEVEPPGVDESEEPGEDPRRRALRLAQAKAASVAARHPATWVIGSDQVASLAGLVLGKPGDAAGCRAQLAAQSGRRVEFHTAVVLRRAQPSASLEHLDLTIVRFRTLSESEIARYVELDAPFDCAGAFRSEAHGSTLFESLETSDPSALVGLPLLWLAGALRSVGFEPLVTAQG
jgi:septum formation protein